MPGYRPIEIRDTFTPGMESLRASIRDISARNERERDKKQVQSRWEVEQEQRRKETEFNQGRQVERDKVADYTMATSRIDKGDPEGAYGYMQKWGWKFDKNGQIVDKDGAPVGSPDTSYGSTTTVNSQTLKSDPAAWLKTQTSGEGTVEQLPPPPTGHEIVSERAAALGTPKQISDWPIYGPPLPAGFQSPDSVPGGSAMPDQVPSAAEQADALAQAQGRYLAAGTNPNTPAGPGPAIPQAPNPMQPAPFVEPPAGAATSQTNLAQKLRGIIADKAVPVLNKIGMHSLPATDAQSQMLPIPTPPAFAGQGSPPSGTPAQAAPVTPSVPPAPGVPGPITTIRQAQQAQQDARVSNLPPPGRPELAAKAKAASRGWSLRGPDDSPGRERAGWSQDELIQRENEARMRIRDQNLALVDSILSDPSVANNPEVRKAAGSVKLIAATSGKPIDATDIVQLLNHRDEADRMALMLATQGARTTGKVAEFYATEPGRIRVASAGAARVTPAQETSAAQQWDARGLAQAQQVMTQESYKKNVNAYNSYRMAVDGLESGNAPLQMHSLIQYVKEASGGGAVITEQEIARNLTGAIPWPTDIRYKIGKWLRSEVVLPENYFGPFRDAIRDSLLENQTKIVMRTGADVYKTMMDNVNPQMNVQARGRAEQVLNGLGLGDEEVRAYMDKIEREYLARKTPGGERNVQRGIKAPKGSPAPSVSTSASGSVTVSGRGMLEAAGIDFGDKKKER